MKYKINPKNGDRLSALGFGCMRFAGDSMATAFTKKIDREKAEKLIVRAVEGGINYFDTAYIYSGSEELLGSTLKKHGLRDQVYIATKLPLILCRKAEDLERFFQIQLERLQTDHIDYYLMHMLTDMKTWETLCSWGIREWIAEKKKNGQIINIGFSFHGEQGEFLSLLEAYDWEFCQIQYNYSNEHYQAGVTGLRAAAAKGIPVMIMEPLLGGRLAKQLPEKAVARFREADPSASPASWGFRWLYDQPEVTVVLSGMNEDFQLTDNLRIADLAAERGLTEEEQQAIEDVRCIFSEAYKIHCTGCHYCMPCPAGVNIPACFAAYNQRYALGRMEGLQQYAMSTLMNGKPSYASLCRQCGKCEAHCPQNLPIRENLKEVRGTFETIWFRALEKLMPLFMRKRKN